MPTWCPTLAAESTDMSLDRHQRAATRRELAANLTLSGRTPEQVCADLGFLPHQLEGALGVKDPVDTWLLRDYLQQVIREAGGTPAPYSVLTDRARAAAEVWFDLRPVPVTSDAANASRA